uniref:Ig-like domain-containing protein n=1 Tax=Schistosoma mansoni TaxID=6183 RepID=A0A5K4FBS1_SCHMA
MFQSIEHYLHLSPPMEEHRSPNSTHHHHANVSWTIDHYLTIINQEKKPLHLLLSLLLLLLLLLSSNMNKWKHLLCNTFKVLYHYIKDVIFIMFGLYLYIRMRNIQIYKFNYPYHPHSDRFHWNKIRYIPKQLLKWFNSVVTLIKYTHLLIQYYNNHKIDCIKYIIHMTFTVISSISRNHLIFISSILNQCKDYILLHHYKLLLFINNLIQKLSLVTIVTHIKYLNSCWGYLYQFYLRFIIKYQYKRKFKQRSNTNLLIHYNYSYILIISKFYLLLLIINTVVCLSTKYTKHINVSLLLLENRNIATTTPPPTTTTDDYMDTITDILDTTNDLMSNTYNNNNNNNNQVQSIYHFKPPDEKRPCRYLFHDDVETSTLLADYVIIGWPIQTYRKRFGPLYNISLLVTNILKNIQYSIFPIRINHLIRIGQFSIFPDPGRCWINVKKNKKYIFFLNQPDWSGFSKITQLPVEYTNYAYNSIIRIMKLGADPLQMRSLYHEDVLKVNEGNDLLLSCRVRGRPTPLISWYVNQTEIKNPWRLETGRGIIQKSRYLSKLQLSNVHTTDNANYTCLAENLNGHIRKSVQVIVKPATTSPPLTTTPPPTTTEMTTTSVHPCHNYCHRGHCYIIDGKPYCSCISQYRGVRCDLFTTEKEENHLEQLPINESKFDSCESGCESNLARILLFSTIGILISLLLIFFLCSIFQICYKKRQSSNRACSSVVKSTVPKDNPENIPCKFNQHPINLSLPKQNSSKLSKIYFNPLFDTYITKECLMNTKTNPIEISSQSTIHENDKPHHHHHHHLLLYNQQLHNSNIKHNCTNNFQSSYLDPTRYLSSKSTMNKTPHLDPKVTNNSHFHKKLSGSSNFVEFIESSPTVQNEILCDSLTTYSGNLPQKSMIPQTIKRLIIQQDNPDKNNTNHLESMEPSLFHNISINESNDSKLICPLNDLNLFPTNINSNCSKLSSQCNLSLLDYGQSNYIPYSNIDSEINQIPIVNNLPYRNNNDHVTNMTDCLNHCHCSTFNKITNIKHLLDDSLIWTNSNNNHPHHQHYTMNTSPLLSLSHNYCQQCLIHNHCNHRNQISQIDQYEDSRNSSIQPEFNSMTNTSDST